MSLLQVVREARRRLAIQRALRRGERIDGLGLLGPGHDAILMKTPTSLQAVGPVDQQQRSAEGQHR